MKLEEVESLLQKVLITEIQENNCCNIKWRNFYIDNGETYKEYIMLRWTLIFLIITLIAALFGFGGISVATAGIAQTMFFVFLALFMISLIAGTMRRS